MNKRCFFCICTVLSVISLIVVSCSTTGVSPSNYSRIQIVNTIPGSLPLDCAINYTKVNSVTLAFPNSTGYISTTSGSKFVTIKPTSTPSADSLAGANVTLKKDSSYSLFFSGQTGAYRKIFVRDDLTVPTTGRAKIRFVNASVSSGSVDVTVNAVIGFKSIAFGAVGNFIEVPAGTYEFKVFSTGTATGTLTTLSNQLLADGKVYTIYAQGTVGSAIATSAFGLSLVANLLPATK